MKLHAICITVVISAAMSLKVDAFEEARVINQLFNMPESMLDLGRIKLTIDSLIDPTIDVNKESEKLDAMVESINAMISKMNVPPNSEVKLRALRTYLYDSGHWNNGHIFEYDKSDPEGSHLPNKLLHNYLTSRSGNCVSMPLLFLVLAERMGINVALSRAPMHLFVKYTDDDGKAMNLETTSGAYPTRDSWYINKLGITDEAIQSGIYMQTMTKKEAIAEISTLLLEHELQKGNYKKVIHLAEVILKEFPENLPSILSTGSAVYHIIERDFRSIYPQPQDIPYELREYYITLNNMNFNVGQHAKSLGWQAQSPQQRENYLKNIVASSSISD